MKNKAEFIKNKTEFIKIKQNFNMYITYCSRTIHPDYALTHTFINTLHA